ncbi:MAG: class I SAM-dependent methyltransferase [Bacteroidetes bacterium]|nr:class I SAM-dependent methyltransferase [Bacteroidota bacterium]GIK70255.1 MAG: hypothetical protein BroJett020_15500 [Bacteroidota bacterium]
MLHFINEYTDSKASDISLKLSKKKHWPNEFIIQQIIGKQKAKKKFPLLASCSEIIYPSLLAIEQASSETTAKYKASLVFGKKLLDLSGGMGIDCFFMATHFEEVYYNEPSTELYEITLKNLQHLWNTKPEYKQKKICFYNQGAEDFLQTNKQKFDCIFIDPSRRKENKKTVSLSECTPNVLLLLPELIKRSNKMLIKASCMLDIKKAVEELMFVQKVHVVSVNNECKELLFECGKIPNKNYGIECINITAKETHRFCFTFNDEKNSTPLYSLPQHYLYDPHSSVTKAGAFNIVSQQFHLKKIAANTHLYTSNKIEKNFPGTIYKVQATVSLNKKEILPHLKQPEAMWMLRHSAFTEKELIQKTGIKNKSSPIVLFSTRNLENKIIIIICNII